MTENIPSAPQPRSYPSHAPSGPIPGNEPPHGPPQPYIQQALPAYGQQPFQQPQYAAPYPPQPYAPAPQPWQQQAKSSGLRVSSGIIAIVLGLWSLAAATAGASMYVDYDGNLNALAYTVMFSLLGLGLIASGIILLVKHRARNGIIPFVVLGLAAVTSVVAVTSSVRQLYGVVPTAITVLLALPIFILLGLGIAKERKGR